MKQKTKTAENIEGTPDIDPQEEFEKNVLR